MQGKFEGQTTVPCKWSKNAVKSDLKTEDLFSNQILSCNCFSLVLKIRLASTTVMI